MHLEIYLIQIQTIDVFASPLAAIICNLLYDCNDPAYLAIPTNLGQCIYIPTILLFVLLRM